MTDWRAYWADAGRRSNDPFRQVDRTVGGQPIAPEQLDALVEDLATRLDLRPTDHLLDLGCGNGLVTARLAGRVAGTVGIDYSSSLLAVANRSFRPANTEYRGGSALDLAAVIAEGERFDKAVLSALLQHVVPGELDRLLDGLARALAPGGRILFADVPDRARLWAFYDTPGRKLIFLRRLLHGGDHVGTWWKAATLVSAARRRGWTAEVVPILPPRDTARYRFDVRIDIPAAS